MTREEHLATCLPCRKGVNCIEWYRRGYTGCWCDECGVEHFTTWDGELLPTDIVTITWWSSWVMVGMRAHPRWGGIRTTAPGAAYGQLESSLGHAYARDTGCTDAEEHTLWIRGVYPVDSQERAMLLAARALRIT